MNSERIPEEWIDRVLQKCDITEIVGSHVHLTKQGKNYKGLCPFHSEKTPSFTIAPDKQIFHCFGCGKGGNAIKFLMEAEGLSFREALKQLAELVNVDVPWSDTVDSDDPHYYDKKLLLQAHELSVKLYHYILMNTKSGRDALDYLHSRGFTDKLIDQFQIGYAPKQWDTLCRFLQQREFSLELMEKGGLLSTRTDGGFIDRFRDRVMFPIHDVSGKAIAFSGRVLSPSQPKYLNSPETFLFNKRKLLYNFHQAKAEIRRLNQAVLFEGFADVIMGWKAGVRHGVATMGTALTKEQILQLKRTATHIVICYDGDSAGQAAALKNAEQFEQARCEVSVALLPDASDPAEYIVKKGEESFLNEIMNQRMPATQYKLVYLKSKHTMNSEEGRLKYVRAALKVIAKLSSPTEREHYVNQLSEEYRYSTDVLKQEMADIRNNLRVQERKRDNPTNPWNNVMNKRRTGEAAPPLLPAYLNAERHLLAAMLHSREVTRYTETELGACFHVEAHAALAAFLYAYFEEHEEMNLNAFISSLKDEGLENIVSSLTMLGNEHSVNSAVIDDYIRQIHKFSMEQTIKEKMDERDRAERSGDVLLAAQIGKEIISLKRGV